MFQFQVFLCIFSKFCKMKFYRFLESKGQMYLDFWKTHCFNHIFLKFCKNCRRATNFFGSLFQSRCSLLWAFFAYFFERFFFSSQTKNFFFFSSESKFRFVTTFLFFNTGHNLMCISWIQKEYSNKLVSGLRNENKQTKTIFWY